MNTKRGYLLELLSLIILMASCESSTNRKHTQNYTPPPPPPPLTVCEIAHNPDQHPGLIDVEGKVISSIAWMDRSLIFLKEEAQDTCILFVLRKGISPSDGVFRTFSGELHEPGKLGKRRVLVLCEPGVDFEKLRSQVNLKIGALLFAYFGAQYVF